MPQSLSNVLVHLVFSTKDRIPLIHPEIEDELHRYLATACRSCGCPAPRVGGTDDHVHLVCSRSRTIAIARLIQEIKADSSKSIKTKGGDLRHFAWPSGYGAFSIGQSQLSRLKAYIAGQREHHRRTTFQEESREFLRKYEIEYDERYVWD